MFCAVARLVDPEGAGQAKLLIVGGHPGSRGVVCSASYEVRAFGVRSGMPIARALRLCPQATAVPVPRKACAVKSREVRAVLEEWAPVVEPASIDEFYLALDGTEAVYREPLEVTAERIRRDVLERTGLAVSVGGGTNRLVAKLAVERAKPRVGMGEHGGSGVHIVPPGEEAAFLATHALDALPGVGPRLRDRLRTYGLVQVQDALDAGPEALGRWLGRRAGEWLLARCRGIASSDVTGRGEAKSVSREETFPADLDDEDRLLEELVKLTERLGRDLRMAGLRGRTVTVKLRDADFRTRHASRTVPVGVATQPALLRLARPLLQGLRQARPCPARLLGVAATQLESAARGQLLLFDTPEESGRDRTLARTLDAIERRFGPGAMTSGRLVRPNRERTP